MIRAADPEWVVDACAFKARYVDPVQAERKAKGMRRRYDRAYMPYRCPFCRGWHVGSKR